MDDLLPPHLRAYLDQDEAAVADLVRHVRDHHTAGCTFPEVCPGRTALEAFYRFDSPTRDRLLFTTIVQLARQPAVQEGQT